MQRIWQKNLFACCRSSTTTDPTYSTKHLQSGRNEVAPLLLSNYAAVGETPQPPLVHCTRPLHCVWLLRCVGELVSTVGEIPQPPLSAAFDLFVAFDFRRVVCCGSPITTDAKYSTKHLQSGRNEVAPLSISNYATNMAKEPLCVLPQFHHH
jgi:hypothetical protein